MKAKLVKESLFEGRYDKDDETPRFSGKGGHYTPDMRNWSDKPENRVQQPVEKAPKIKAPRKKYPTPLWNKVKYSKWLKMMAHNNDNIELPDDYAREMAVSGKYEKGLYDYVRNIIKRNHGSEEPVERITWDIEELLDY